MLVAPSEPPALRAIGKTSLLPERFGCDILFTVRGERVGVQRKEVKDLRASAVDGRLAKELAQMSAVGRAMLLVEGKVSWTLDGGDLNGGRWGQAWTRAQWNGLLWSVQSRGVWVCASEGVPETVQIVQEFERWCRKEKHTSLDSRPKPGSMWGSSAKMTEREWGVHLLQGLDGVGPELAGRIFDRAGSVPIRWSEDVDIEWLMGVEGVGSKKATRIYRALQGTRE